MFEITVNRVNYWTYTCSIKLYRTKPPKVYPITKDEYESFEIWKFNNAKVNNIISRKQINGDRNKKITYTHDLIKCECGNSWIMDVKHIRNYTEYNVICPKCGKLFKNFKN